MRYIVLITLLLVATTQLEDIDTSTPLEAVSIQRVDPKEAKCLATTIYGEARGESVKGQIAVAYTAVNRATNRRICQVVLAPKQYSVFNDNPSLRKAAMSLKIVPRQKNIIDVISWKQATEIAEAILKKEIPDPTNGATHYFSPSLMKIKGYIYPAWVKEYKLVAVIDRHKFYKPKEKRLI